MMGEESFTRNRNLKELAELHYRIDKLKKMGIGWNREDLMPNNEQEYIERDVSSLFFLGRYI